MNKELQKVLEKLIEINKEQGYVSYEDVAIIVRENGLTPKDVKVLYKELSEQNIALKDVKAAPKKTTTKTTAKKEAKVETKSETKKAAVSEIKPLKDREKELIALGKKQGFITYETLAEHLKGLDLDADALDELYNALIDNHIDIVSDDDSSSSNKPETEERVN